MTRRLILLTSVLSLGPAVNAWGCAPVMPGPGTPKLGDVALSGVVTGLVPNTDPLAPRQYTVRPEQVLRGTPSISDGTVIVSTGRAVMCTVAFDVGSRWLIVGTRNNDGSVSTSEMSGDVQLPDPAPPLDELRELLNWPAPPGFRVARGDLRISEAAALTDPTVWWLGGTDGFGHHVLRIMRRGSTVTTVYRMGLRVASTPRRTGDLPTLPANGHGVVRIRGAFAVVGRTGLTIWMPKVRVGITGPGGYARWRRAVISLRPIGQSG